MADRYLVAIGTWDASNTALWAASSGGAAGASAPTALDNVFIDGASPNGTVVIAAGAACKDFTVTWQAVQTNLLRLSSNFAPAGNVSINGNSTINRIRIQSDTLGTQRTIAVGSAPVLSNVNFRDINGSGGGTWSGTSIGDCLGNSGIAFDASTTCSPTGTTSFNWNNAARWSPRVPLPQDDVVMTNAFGASQAITMSMPDVCRSLDISGVTGSPNFSVSIQLAVYGSVSWVLGATATASSSWSFLARSAATLSGNGGTFNGTVILGGPGASWSQLSGWSGTTSASNPLNINIPGGSFSTNGFDLNLGGATASAKLLFTAGTYNLGASTITLSGTGTTVNYQAGTLNPGTSTIKITDSTASTKTFAGGSQTYNRLWFNSSGSGALQFTGSNSFATLQADSGCSLQFTAGTTTTATTWAIDGCTIGSITASNHTVAKAGGGRVQCTGVSVSRSTASPANTFYDVGGTDGGNNIDWTFGAFMDLDAVLFQWNPQDVSMLANRFINLEPVLFELFPQDIQLGEFVLDPRYTIRAGSRSRSIRGPSRNSIRKEVH